VNWRPDKKEALKKLVRETIEGAGETPPDELPHRLRERLRAHAAGERELDEVIREVIAERAKRA